MEKVLFLCYPKCSTCQKAKKWLEEHSIEYTERHIAEENPTYDELEVWYKRSGLPLKKFFNTSGLIYKEMKLKDKLPLMSEEEQLKLLATNGMLVKRPMVITDDKVLAGFKENEWELLIQPEKSKCIYMSEEGKEAARALPEQYNVADKNILMRFEFRNIKPSEIEEVIEIEQICFPPNEACSPKSMRERIAVADELFLVAVDKETGKIAGFLNGIATDEYRFRDEFFTDVSLHKKSGKNIMLVGLDVLPEYRKQGLGRELVYQYLRRERENGRKAVFLTCLQAKVEMYKKFGFTDHGIANSTWGGEEWHEMSITLGGENDGQHHSNQ